VGGGVAATKKQQRSGEGLEGCVGVCGGKVVHVGSHESYFHSDGSLRWSRRGPNR
jgi:hypothetical protein